MTQHWLAEAAAVITRLDSRRARQAVSLLYALELPILMDVEVYQKACDLSTTLTQHLFDTLYHAVALHESAAIPSLPMTTITEQLTESGGSSN